MKELGTYLAAIFVQKIWMKLTYTNKSMEHRPPAPCQCIRTRFAMGRWPPGTRLRMHSVQNRCRGQGAPSNEIHFVSEQQTWIAKMCCGEPSFFLLGRKKIRSDAKKKSVKSSMPIWGHTKTVWRARKGKGVKSLLDQDGLRRPGGFAPFQSREKGP